MKNNYRKSGNTVVLLVGIVALVIVLIGAFLAPLITFYQNRGGEIAKAAVGESCVVSDDVVTDMSATTETIMTRLMEREGYKNRIEEVGKEDFRRRVDEIVGKGSEKNINPIIPIAIWWGEQSFRNPEKAFGYRYFDRGTDQRALEGTLEERWQFQLEGVYRTINRAITEDPPYNEPHGKDIITRLFFNYATAMGDQFRESGQRWSRGYSDPEHGNPFFNRANMIEWLRLNSLICTDPFMVAGISEGTVPRFNQDDGRWANEKIVPDHNFRNHPFYKWGCCPTAAAMMIAFHGIKTNPIEVGRLTTGVLGGGNSFYVPGEGTNHSEAWLNRLGEHFDLPVRWEFFVDENDNRGWDRVINHLKDGKPLIARGDHNGVEGRRPFTSQGHCVVFVRYNEQDNTIFVHDTLQDRPSQYFPVAHLRKYTTNLHYIGR